MILPGLEDIHHRERLDRLGFFYPEMKEGEV